MDPSSPSVTASQRNRLSSAVITRHDLFVGRRRDSSHNSSTDSHEQSSIHLDLSIGSAIGSVLSVIPSVANLSFFSQIGGYYSGASARGDAEDEFPAEHRATSPVEPSSKPTQQQQTPMTDAATAGLGGEVLPIGNADHHNYFEDDKENSQMLALDQNKAGAASSENNNIDNDDDLPAPRPALQMHISASESLILVPAGSTHNPSPRLSFVSQIFRTASGELKEASPKPSFGTEPALRNSFTKPSARKSLADIGNTSTTSNSNKNVAPTLPNAVADSNNNNNINNISGSSDALSGMDVETELGLALDSLLLSQPCHLKNGFRVFSLDRKQSTVVFSLRELELGTKYLTENGTRISRASENIVNLGEWNTINLDDMHNDSHHDDDVVLDQKDLLFTPPKIVLRPCAFCTETNPARRTSISKAHADAMMPATATPAAAAASAPAQDPAATDGPAAAGFSCRGNSLVTATSTAEAMLERVTHFMLEQGVPMYVDGTDRGRVVFSLEELEPKTTYKSMDGLIKIRRLSVGGVEVMNPRDDEHTDTKNPFYNGDASFVVTATGLPSIAEEALETALGGNLQEGIIVLRPDCNRAQLIKSIKSLPDKVEYKSLCGHVTFFRVDLGQDDMDLFINGLRYPLRAKANVTTATAPSFLNSTHLSYRTPKAKTPHTNRKTGGRTRYVDRIMQVQSAIKNANAQQLSFGDDDDDQDDAQSRLSGANSPHMMFTPMVWDNPNQNTDIEGTGSAVRFQMQPYREEYFDAVEFQPTASGKTPAAAAAAIQPSKSRASQAPVMIGGGVAATGAKIPETIMFTGTDSKRGNYTNGGSGNNGNGNNGARNTANDCFGSPEPRAIRVMKVATPPPAVRRQVLGDLNALSGNAPATSSPKRIQAYVEPETQSKPKAASSASSKNVILKDVTNKSPAPAKNAQQKFVPVVTPAASGKSTAGSSSAPAKSAKSAGTPAAAAPASASKAASGRAFGSNNGSAAAKPAQQPKAGLFGKIKRFFGFSPTKKVRENEAARLRAMTAVKIY